VDDVFRDQECWTRMGKFSSDRAISEYCRDILKAESVSVDLD
jgi:hypothetical protein